MIRTQFPFLFPVVNLDFRKRSRYRWSERPYQRDLIDFSLPGKPTDNAFCESFNGTFRAKCLDTNWFQTLPEQSFLSNSGGMNIM